MENNIEESTEHTDTLLPSMHMRSIPLLQLLDPAPCSRTVHAGNVVGMHGNCDLVA